MLLAGGDKLNIRMGHAVCSTPSHFFVFLKVVMDADDFDMDPEAMLSMPSSLDGAGFYAPTRLRLLPASILPAEAPFDKTSFWIFTVTPESKGVKKSFASPLLAPHSPRPSSTLTRLTPPQPSS